MENSKKEASRIITATCRRECGRFDDDFSNQQVLTYQVIDEIIRGLIEEDVKPRVEIDFFDQWLNLIVSSSYELEFNEDSTEVTCSFTVNNVPDPDGNLMASVEFAGGEDLGNSINENLLKKINSLNASEPGDEKEKEADYLEIIENLGFHLAAFRYLSLYVREQFEECKDIFCEVGMSLESPHLNFIIILIDTCVNLICGSGAKVIENINNVITEGMEFTEAEDFKSSIYGTIGRYLEENKRGVNRILHDHTFPISEKYSLLFSTSISLQKIGDNRKAVQYLRLAEKYAGKNINHSLYLIDALNELELWEDALQFITRLEKEQGKKLVLTYAKVKTLMAGEQHQEALKLLEKLMVESEEENVEMLCLKGDCFLTQKRFLEAVACYNRVLDIEPDFAKALINLGAYYYFELKDYRKALHYLLTAEKQGDLHFYVYEIISEIYRELELERKHLEYEIKAKNAKVKQDFD
ncbi:MAG: hypothetical protein K9M99_09415 [Candidatus Cloacimonetes bacterium]|nr:hypothetical protein [Candidatus Cloacimonadota bacterium]